MLFHIDIKADGLPDRTVCLTYDDGPGASTGEGPGPRTAELGEYLHSRRIPATFFVIGRHAENDRDLLARLVGWGHLIGNHTYSHPGLANLAATGGDVIGEIARTDEIIAPFVGAGVTFLRPPYGNWRETEPVGGAVRDRPFSCVARALNADGRFRNHVGPINWDISGEDYDFWRQGLPAEDCARRYLERIRSAGRGLILMHDSSEDECLRAGNRTYEVTRIIVPILESEGYRFLQLDGIPQVQSAMRVSSVIALRHADGRFLACSDEPRGRIVAEARSVGAREQFGVVGAGAGQIALRATNGRYLAAARGGDDEVVAAASTLDEAILFDRIPAADVPADLGTGDRAISLEPAGAVRWRPASRRRGAGEEWTMRDLFDASGR